MDLSLPTAPEHFTTEWLNEHLVVPGAGEGAKIIACRSRASIVLAPRLAALAARSTGSLSPLRCPSSLRKR